MPAYVATFLVPSISTRDTRDYSHYHRAKSVRRHVLNCALFMEVPAVDLPEHAVTPDFRLLRGEYGGQRRMLLLVSVRHHDRRVAERAVFAAPGLRVNGDVGCVPVVRFD